MSSSTRTLTGVPFGFLSLNYNTFNEIRSRTIRLENKLDYYIYNYYWMCANVVLEKICGCFSFFYCFVLWFNLFEHFEFINRLKEENALNALFNFLFFCCFYGGHWCLCSFPDTSTCYLLHFYRIKFNFTSHQIDTRSSKSNNFILSLIFVKFILFPSSKGCEFGCFPNTLIIMKIYAI